jgi:hypothetical protein
MARHIVRRAASAATVLVLAVFVALLNPLTSARSSAAGDPTVIAAGDIACDPSVGWFNGGAGDAGDCQEMATAGLLPGADAVLPLGDEQYNCGGAAAFAQSYDPSWGQQKGISHPIPGNHEYLTSGGTDCSTQFDAAAYYKYFGSSAGDPTKGYYSYDLGAWHIIALNSECGYVASLGACGSGSPEETWLRNDLAAHSTASCTLAYWHRPRFASTDSGGDTSFNQFWVDLYAAHVDVVLNGHAHWYERFAQQNPSGQVDPNGIREFIVGTGGEEDGSAPTRVLPNSQVNAHGVFGALKMTLHPGSYDWNFIRTPNSTSTFSDSGSTACHQAGSSVDTTAPTTTITCNASPCTNTSYSGAVTVALSASDTGGSGVASTRYTTDGTDPATSPSAVTYTQPFSIGQTTLVKFASTDNAGNQEAAQSQQIQVTAGDTTPPTTSITCNGSPCSSASYSAPVNVALSASDAGGSGVAGTQYTIDGSDPTTGGSALTYTQPFSVSQTTTVKFASIDNAGNQEPTRSQQIQVATAPVDTTAPTTSIACNGSSCSTGWYTGSVTASLSATDSGSGVKRTTYTTDGTDPSSSGTAVVYSGPFTVSQTTTVKYSSQDVAGNVEATTSKLIRVDTAAPSVTITAPTDGSSYKRGVSIQITATAADTGTGGKAASGIASVAFYRGTVKIATDSSSPYSVSWNTSGRALGTYSLTAVATDKAGNTRTSSVVRVSLVR